MPARRTDNETFCPQIPEVAVATVFETYMVLVSVVRVCLWLAAVVVRGWSTQWLIQWVSLTWQRRVLHGCEQLPQLLLRSVQYRYT